MERVIAPIPGTVTSVAVKEGQTVKAGQTLLTLEALKMQNEIFSETGGTVKEILVNEGSKVAANKVLAVID